MYFNGMSKSFGAPTRDPDTKDKLLILGNDPNIAMLTIQASPGQQQNLTTWQRYGGLTAASVDKNGQLTIGGTDPLAIATTTLTINCYSISNGSSFTSTIATDAGGGLILTSGGAGNGNMQCTNGTIYYGIGNSGQATQAAFIVSATSLGRSPSFCYIHSTKTLWIGASDTNNFGPTQGGVPGTAVISAMQGGGTDITGGAIVVSAGQGSGAGPSGNVLVKIANPGSSGASLNALVTCITVSPTTQNVLIQGLSSAVKACVIQGVASRAAPLLQLQTSAAASLGNVGSCAFDDIATVSTTHVDGTFDTLSTHTTVANSLVINGDKIEFDYVLTVVGHALSTDQIQVLFGGITIFDSTAQNYAVGATVRIIGQIIRVTATTCRSIVSFLPAGSATILGYEQMTYTSDATLTGMTLTGTNILLIRAAATGTNSASGDVSLVMGTIDIIPAGS